MPAAAEVTRAEFESAIRDPLRAEFNRRGWWKLAADRNGLRAPAANKIRVLACIRGVPLKVKRLPAPPAPPPKPGEKPPAQTPQQMIQQVNEAAVDSELAIVGIHELPAAGAVNNHYFQSELPITAAKLPFLILVGRIDAADDATCRRMIDDALAAERTGLWGRAFVDLANKIPDGDNWLRGAADAARRAGIPTVVDRFDDTLPTNYPMTGAALYLGWYAEHVNGPLLAPDFRFRRGAVAVHLHSFSASQLTDPRRHWCAPLLDRGAAATLGNVYEPFLGMTHHLETFARRLLAGHTLVEAAYMSAPGLSWQNVVLGDPLYQPFRHLGGGGRLEEADREFRALRVATMRWGEQPAELRSHLARAAAQRNSGTLFEALGLTALADGESPVAAGFFDQARAAFTEPRDRLRQEFHLVGIDRAAGRTEAAIARLRTMKFRNDGLPTAAAVTGWLNILDPPPPPPPPPPANRTPAKPASPR